MIQIGAPAATIDMPIEHLMACHRRIEQRLDALVNAATHFTETPEAAISVIRNSFDFLDNSGAMHTEDEEESLFPRLRPSLSEAESEFIVSLESEHEKADSIYQELKQCAATLSSHSTADSVDQFARCAERLRAIYRRHIQSEDEILVALARRCLDGDALKQISQEMRARRR